MHLPTRPAMQCSTALPTADRVWCVYVRVQDANPAGVIRLKGCSLACLPPGEDSKHPVSRMPFVSTEPAALVRDPPICIFLFWPLPSPLVDHSPLNCRRYLVPDPSTRHAGPRRLGTQHCSMHQELGWLCCTGEPSPLYSCIYLVFSPLIYMYLLTENAHL